MTAKKFFTGIVLLFFFGVTGCQMPAKEETPVRTENGVVSVVTTTPILAALTHITLGGLPNIEIKTLLPTNIVPEEYEPTPEQKQMLEKADFYGTLGFEEEPFTRNLFAELQNKAVRRITVSSQLSPEVQSENIELYWYDPQTVQDILTKLQQEFSQTLPAHDKSVRHNVAIFLFQLKETLRPKAEQISKLPPKEYFVWPKLPSNFFTSFQIPVAKEITLDLSKKENVTAARQLFQEQNLKILIIATPLPEEIQKELLTGAAIQYFAIPPFPNEITSTSYAEYMTAVLDTFLKALQ